VVKRTTGVGREPGVWVRFELGPLSATGESASSCFEPGVPGTYNLRLTAPGFQDATLRVVVPGTTPECGCPTVQAQQVSVVLTPS
jgi:hypothetical protein